MHPTCLQTLFSQTSLLEASQWMFSVHCWSTQMLAWQSCLGPQKEWPRHSTVLHVLVFPSQSSGTEASQSDSVRHSTARHSGRQYFRPWRVSQLGKHLAGLNPPLLSGMASAFWKTVFSALAGLAVGEALGGLESTVVVWDD